MGTMSSTLGGIITLMLLFLADRGESMSLECDIVVTKGDICSPFTVYEYGLSRCVQLTGDTLKFHCGAFKNVKVCIFFSLVVSDDVYLRRVRYQELKQNGSSRILVFSASRIYL
jgi:hypothetical protein